MLFVVRDRVYDLDENDVFMYNGYSFQLLTRRVNIGSKFSSPEIVRLELMRKWLDEGVLELVGKVYGFEYYRLSDKVVER